jgi:hypothetical protein
MIPTEVAAIADLIFPQWTETDDIALNEVLEAAWRIYRAGYRRQEGPKP